MRQVGFQDQLLGLLRELAKAGKREEARKTLDALERRGAPADFAARFHWLREIAVARAVVGDFEGALGMAASIPNALLREEAWAGIAVALAQSGDLGAAERTLAPVEDPDIRGYALEAIAPEQAKAGDFAGAVRSATVSWEEGHDLGKGRTLQRVAALQAKAGEGQQALAWARRLPSTEVRTWALIGLAEGLLERAGSSR